MHEAFKGGPDPCSERAAAESRIDSWRRSVQEERTTWERETARLTRIAERFQHIDAFFTVARKRCVLHIFLFSFLVRFLTPAL